MKDTTKEGKANIFIDKADIVTRKLEAFYNPKMKLNRDISILLLNTLQKEDTRILLPLAGTGVRGVRLLQEVEGISQLHLNDFDGKAVEYIKENLKKNKLAEDERVFVHNEDANYLLCKLETGFDYIDVDPFGSPNFVLENATRRVKTKGILAVTATDTGALAGTYVNAGKAKYWAKPGLCPQQHEMGIRILARKVVMQGMHQDKRLTPVFCYHHEHYYRLFFLVEKGRQKASEQYKHIEGKFHHCKGCGAQWTHKNESEACEECGSKQLTIVGPLYTGELHSKELLNDMLTNCSDKKITKMLTLAQEELTLDLVGYYDMHAICDIHKARTQPNKKIREALEAKGYETCAVSTNSYGIKTNAPYKEVLELFLHKV